MMAGLVAMVKCNFKNSLIIHEENVKGNHGRVEEFLCDRDLHSFTQNLCLG